MSKKLPNYILQHIPRLRDLIKDTVPEFKDKDLTQYVRKASLWSAKGNSCWEFSYKSKIKSELKIKFIRDCGYYLGSSEMWMLCSVKNYDYPIEDDYDFRSWHTSNYCWINIRNSKQFNKHCKFLLTPKYII